MSVADAPGAGAGAPGGADPERALLDSRLLAWMRGPFRGDEGRFQALALALFAHQFARCEPYRRFCQGRGSTPDRVEHWWEIPAVPTGAFKELELRSFPEARGRHVFRTSGTGGETRGALWLDTLSVYEASLLPTFERFVLPDLAPGERIRTLVLAPSPREVPDSSLSHMFGVVLAARGAPGSGFFVRGGALEEERLAAALEEAEASSAPLLLAGTAFAFVHLLDALAARGQRLRLPDGSRAMETGGFKGRSREVSRDALYSAIEATLGVGPARVVNQYGMTELGSQFYDSVLAEPRAPRRKLGPPWARVRIVDERGAERPAGEPGIVTVYDLANSGSVLAIQTADLGVRAPDGARAAAGWQRGFQVLGRAVGAEARGCSLALDAMLGGGAATRGAP